ncbi:MAG: PqqD family protein [Thermoanaerobaculaceae bacterium]|jgi:hypothetical protein|nr:PqqD family protein [Thermoanaerobaculaceae bacterium]
MAETWHDVTIRLSGRVRFRTVAEEGVLVHLRRGQVIVVSRVGLVIVKALAQGATSAAALAELVAGEFQVELGQARRDVEAFLDQLRAEEVLEEINAGAATARE